MGGPSMNLLVLKNPARPHKSVQNSQWPISWPPEMAYFLAARNSLGPI